VVDEDRDERDPTPEIDGIGFAVHSIDSGVRRVGNQLWRHLRPGQGIRNAREA
jgi:hypothetical protein